MGSDEQPKVPVLDFTNKDLKPGTTTWSSTCKSVRQALEEFGFFKVIYDKASPKLREEVLRALKDLFDLPSETKKKNKYEGMPKKLGHVAPVPAIPLHESLGIYQATILEEVQSFANLMWPDGNDNFCKYVYEYAKIAEHIDRMVSRMIFESYSVDKYYDSYIKSTVYLLRALKNRAPQENENNLGFVTHTDKSFTTILHQFNGVNALVVETKDRNWMDVDFSSPDSFVVMAGDALMAWSNDRIQAPNHKVVMSGNETRYSTGFFAFSKGMLQVPEELVDDEHPLQYKPFDNIELLDFDYKSHMKAFCGV